MFDGSSGARVEVGGKDHSRSTVPLKIVLTIMTIRSKLEVYDGGVEDGSALRGGL